MQITSIEQQKNNPKRYSVFIDGDFAFGLNEVDVLYYKLSESEEISPEKLNLIIEETVYKKALDKVLKMLASRQRSKHEITQRLMEDGCGEEIINRVLETLGSYGYINDEKFALAYLSELRSKGYGAFAVSQKLRGRGIPREIISAVLNSDTDGETDSCITALNKKYRGETLDKYIAKKAFAFLARKGFSPDIIKAAIKQYNGEL